MAEVQEILVVTVNGHHRDRGELVVARGSQRADVITGGEVDFQCGGGAVRHGDGGRIHGVEITEVRLRLFDGEVAGAGLDDGVLEGAAYVDGNLVAGVPGELAFDAVERHLRFVLILDDRPERGLAGVGFKLLDTTRQEGQGQCG